MGYCSNCGEDLTCISCMGSGKKEISWIETGTYCCGQSQFGNYCPDCGKNLDTEREIKNKDCLACRGKGEKDHFCL